MNIIIVGASFSGLSAAIKARQLYPQASVRVIERRSTLPDLPNSFWSRKETGSIESMKMFEEEKVRRAGIELSLGTEVVTIKPEKQLVVLSHGGTLSYSHLILAMGSTQESSYIKGSHLPRVFTCKDVDNRPMAQDFLAATERVAIIGAGQIGIEASETYLQQGKTVYLFEANVSLDFKFFDSQMLDPLRKSLEDKGIQFFCQQRVKAIEESEGGLVVVASEQRVEVDAVLLCAGFRPNTKLLADLPVLALDGTVKVDSYLRTPLPKIWAVGDLIALPLLEAANLSYNPLINSALRTGALVAYNLVQPRYQFPSTTYLVACYQYGWYRTAIGLTAEEASLYHDISVVDYQAPFSLSNQNPIYMRLIVLAKTGRILGLRRCPRWIVVLFFRPWFMP